MGNAWSATERNGGGGGGDEVDGRFVLGWKKANYRKSPCIGPGRIE